MTDIFLGKSSADFSNVLLVHLVKEIVEFDSAVVGVELFIFPQLGLKEAERELEDILNDFGTLKSTIPPILLPLMRPFTAK